MNRKSLTAPSPDQPLSRELLLTLLNTALGTGELHYARNLCTAWLEIFPGDLPVSLIYAQSFNIDKSPDLQQHAVPILEELCKIDPEFLEAQQLMADVDQMVGSSKQLVAKACANALSRTGQTGSNGNRTSWAKYIHEARSALAQVQAGNQQQIEKAEYFVHKALVENPNTPLAAIVHLRTVSHKTSMPKLAVQSLAQMYHERWPDCLQFTLGLANELMETGASSQAVEMLHQAVEKDITGQVPRRMWGDEHPYQSIWPVNLEASPTRSDAPQNIPVPAAVASILGWNQLSAMSSDYTGASHFSSEATSFGYDFSRGKSTTFSYPSSTPAPSPEVPPLTSQPTQSAQTELERMAEELKRPHIAHENGRFPVYVVFTSQSNLIKQYGQQTFIGIDAELKRLVKVVHGHRISQELWGSLLFYADDPKCTQAYGLPPVSYIDPSGLKQVISSLDTAMQKRGERIGALLIVGGPEIVPFHNLPNPVEDADNEVPSDNPYSTRDGNYFISDWPVGRVSGGSGSQADSILKVIKEIINRYDEHASKPSWYFRLIEFFSELIKTGLSKKLSSFGYTAAVWRRASLSVFRSIGNPDELLISPPVHACEEAYTSGSVTGTVNTHSEANTCLVLPDTRLAYFNLHGVPDSSEWYGQSDPSLPEDGPEFPVAMRPEDIRNGGSAPRTVFTEACYGANIIGKTVDEAISLKFLASGTQAIIGSTCISYGSLSTPLSSADLLGRVFWNHLQEGFTAGESLRRAKIQMTREMNTRQGFLDAEDQKTLISFVLFGDPLAQPFQSKSTPKITPHLSDAAVPVRTVCERSCEGEAGSSVSLETISHLKSIVAQYLPGMNDAQVNLYHEHQTCANLCGHCGTGKKCGISNGNGKNQTPLNSQRRVVTLSKNFERANHTHRQYARLTLDERGRIVKMVVSH